VSYMKPNQMDNPREKCEHLCSYTRASGAWRLLSWLCNLPHCICQQQNQFTDKLEGHCSSPYMRRPSCWCKICFLREFGFQVFNLFWFLLSCMLMVGATHPPAQFQKHPVNS
jgi:hypothetical protein